MRRTITELLTRLSNHISSSQTADPTDHGETPTTAAADATHRAYREDAQSVSTALLDRFSPDTVLHLGCGIGLHLKPFLDADIDAHGIDGSTTAHERAVVPTDRIMIADLTRPYRTNQDYDLVLCFDLLAHSPDAVEQTIIQTIVDAGTTAVISPATSEQAGFATQDDDYWIDRFQDAGMTLQEPATTWFRDQIADIRWTPHRPLIFKHT